ncbi:MAG: hypothetical protein AB1696_22685 [Planctomycetota bacterium]
MPVANEYRELFYKTAMRVALVFALVPAWRSISTGADVFPKPSASLSMIRQRYLDLVRYSEQDWDNPDVAKLAGQIEYETGRLLQEQVSDPESSWHGFFGQPEKGTMGGQALMAAREKADKAIHVLTSAYWCKGRRFYQSQRVLRCIEQAYSALDRKVALSDVKSVYDVPQPYFHRRENLCRWLAQVGEFLSKDVRVHMKDTLRHLLVRQEATTVDRALYTLLGAACFEDDRLLHTAAKEMAELALKPVGTIAPEGGPSIEDAAEYCAAISQYQYFTLDTELALPADALRPVHDIMRDFISWTVYQGRADLLAYHSPRKWSGQVERDIVATVAHLTAAQPDMTMRWRFAYDEVVQHTFGRKENAYYLLDVYRLISQVASVPSCGVDVETKYFEDEGYLAVRRPSFFGSLRFPFRKGRAIDYSQLDVPMNVRSTANDPNLLFLLPEFEPLLSGCTFSQFVANPKGQYDARECSATTCADATVLDGQAAIAGVRLRIKRKDNFLATNKSWIFFEDKMIFSASGVETKSFDLRNHGWSASPTDHRVCITFVFPQPVEIDLARIYFRVYRGRLDCVPRNIYFLVSPDGVTWTRVREAKPEDLPKSGDVPLGGFTYRLRRSKVPYYRLYFPYGADGFTTQISEVELYKSDPIYDPNVVPPGAVNLAPKGRVFATSTLDQKHGPEQLTDGKFAATLEPPALQTSLAVLRTGGARFTYQSSRGLRSMDFPALGKEIKLKDVAWCHTKQTAYVFPYSVDLILKGVGNGYGRISIDHARNDRFAAVCFPNLDLEQTPRAVEAGLIKLLRLDSTAHVFFDPASGTTAAAFFDVVEGGNLASDGPAYLLLRQHPDLLVAAKSHRGAPSDIWIEAPDAKTLVINSKVQPVYMKGKMVRVSAHR